MTLLWCWGSFGSVSLKINKKNCHGWSVTLDTSIPLALTLTYSLLSVLKRIRTEQFVLTLAPLIHFTLGRGNYLSLPTCCWMSECYSEYIVSHLKERPVFLCVQKFDQHHCSLQTVITFNKSIFTVLVKLIWKIISLIALIMVASAPTKASSVIMWIYLLNESTALQGNLPLIILLS